MASCVCLYSNRNVFIWHVKRERTQARTADTMRKTERQWRESWRETVRNFNVCVALWAAPCVSSHRPLEYFSIAFSCGFGIGRFTNLNPIKKWHFYDISFSIHPFEARSMRLRDGVYQRENKMVTRFINTSQFHSSLLRLRFSMGSWMPPPPPRWNGQLFVWLFW